MPDDQSVPSILLAWYDANRRDLPWRARPGQSINPYWVWLSEIMLQQTTVVTVTPYFEKFLSRWPRLDDLAVAPLDDILKAWAGLGYYARARNLHKCAGIIADEHGGQFPRTEAALLQLPGIGRYTGAAIAAIAFDQPATAVDGNVERVMARLFAVDDPLPGAKKALYDRAQSLTPEARPGDYAQAVMDLGATVCTPRSPSCSICPLENLCAARRQGLAEALPARLPKEKRPTRYGTAYWLEREGPGGREVLLRRRPEEGLLGGMMEIPSTPWREGPGARDGDPGIFAAEWQAVDGGVSHVFTHFRLELSIERGVLALDQPADGHWTRIEDLEDEALPSVMRKVVARVLS